MFPFSHKQITYALLIVFLNQALKVSFKSEFSESILKTFLQVFFWHLKHQWKVWSG